MDAAHITLHECAPLRARITATQCAVNRAKADADWGSPCLRCVAWQEWGRPVTTEDVPLHPFGHRYNKPKTETVMSHIPVNATELAHMCGVSVGDVYNAMKRLRRGETIRKGKAFVVAQRVQALGIAPDHFSKNHRCHTPAPFPPASATAAPENVPHDNHFLAALDRLAAQQPAPGLDIVPLESLVAEIRRRMPRAVVVLR